MRVKDQNHGAVAHDSGPGNAFEIAKIRTQGLDDDFLAFQKLIHDQTQTAFIIMDDHHGQDIGQRVGTRQAEHFRKFHNAQHFAAQCDGLTSMIARVNGRLKVKRVPLPTSE